MTATLTAPATHLGWTAAYRKPRANKFHRVVLPATVVLTEEQAKDMGEAIQGANPGLEVYIVPTLAAEKAGQVPEEDHGNVLVHTGRRIRITETGDLTALNVEIPSDVELAFDRAEELTAQVSERYQVYVTSIHETGTHSEATQMCRETLLDTSDIMDLAIEYARALLAFRSI